MEKSADKTDYASMILDLMAIATMPFIFGFSILWEYGRLHSLLTVSLVILVTSWTAAAIIYRKSIFFPKIYRFLLVVIGIIVLSSSINTITLYKNGGIIHADWIDFIYIDALVLVVAMFAFAVRREPFELGIRITSFVVLLTGMWGYIHYVLNTMALYQTDVDYARAWRPYSVYGNPIPAGHIFLMFLWIPFSLNYEELSEKKKSIDALIRIVVYVPFIILTRSRSVWMGLFFTTIIWLMVSSKYISEKWMKLSVKGKRIAVFSISAAMLIGVSFAILLMAPRFKDFRNSEAYVVRTSYIKYTLDQVANSNFFHLLFGYGSGSSRDMIFNSPCYVEPFNICDNAYLSMLYEWGIIAIFSVIVIDVIAFITIIRLTKCRQRSMSLFYAFSVIACIIPIFFYEAQMWSTVAVHMAIFVAGSVYKFERE